MAQHDYDIANQSGANFRADLNNALDAIVSNNSGTNQPSTMFAYEWWVDTTNNLLKIRNSANNAWITLPLSITADNSTSGALTVNGNLSTTGTLDVNGGEIILDADADTSITSDTDDQIDFKTAGADRVVITSEGKFGIGNQTPSQLLNVQSATFPVAEISCFSDSNPTDGSALDLVEKQPSFASASNTFGQTGVYGYRIKLNGSDNTLRIKSGAQSTVTDRIVLQRDSGAVGIGVVDGDVVGDGVAARTYVGIIGSGNRGVLALGSTASAGADGGKLSFVNGTNVTGEISCDPDVASATNGNLAFNTTNTLRLKITSSGRMFLGGTQGFGNGFFEVNASPSTFNHIVTRPTVNATYNALRMINNSNTVIGTISVGTSVNTVTYGGTSDYRLKENIKPMEQGLERVKKLKPVKFDWKETGESSEGFIAHEIQEAGWNLGVVGEKDGKEMQEVEYGKLTPLLVKAIQELEEKVKKLEG